jgi:DNA-binding XRE family transcriptional regulator
LRDPQLKSQPTLSKLSRPIGDHSNGMTALRLRLGRAIRRLREERDISQEAFAQKAKVHRTTMSEIERGITNISVDIAERIANALNHSLSELFSAAESQRHK